MDGTQVSEPIHNGSAIDRSMDRRAGTHGHANWTWGGSLRSEAHVAEEVGDLEESVEQEEREATQEYRRVCRDV